ncbi:MAG: ATP-binding protein [Pseudomonadota bacterium]
MPTRDKNLLRALFYASAEAIVVVDLDRRILSVNNAFTELFGLQEDEVVGKTTEFLYAEPGEYDRAGRERFNRGTSQQRSSERVCYRRHDGSVFLSETVGTRIMDDEENPIGFLGIIRDVTAEEEMKAALVKEKDRAQAAARAKSDFLANMSHEIRTPMNSIVGLSQLLERRLIAPDVKEYARVISQSAASLLGILNNILDLSKIDVGAVAIETIETDITETVQQAVETIRPQSAERNVVINWSVDSSVEGPFNTDPTKIIQVLTNLISNAAKFTPTGGRVQVTVKDESPTPRSAGESGGVGSAKSGERQIRFSVQDTGVGLANVDIDRLFEPFTQADASITRKHGGTGLGLAIAARIVKALGGQINACNRPEGGAEFTFVLPLTPLSQCADEKSSETPESRARSFDALSLLLVDDNETNRFVAGAIFGSRVGKLDFATNGEEGVNMCRAKRYDAVLMDIQMPVMDGVAAMQEIRRQEAEQSLAPTKIIAFTAHAFEEQVLELLSAGFDAHMAKPADIDSLERALVDLGAAA